MSPQQILSAEKVQTLETGNSWDFKNAGDWINSTYLNGNKTRLIVGIGSSKSSILVELEEIVGKHRAEIVDRVLIRGDTRAVVVEILLNSVTAFVEDVRRAGLASYVEPNMKVEAQFLPNDPYWSLQWGPQRIEADKAWDVTSGDSSVLVAVVDTGVCYTHPDLAAEYVPLGYDWVNLDSDPLDDHGHGTHCAGIIAGVLNNGIGIAGLAQVRVMAEKVLDSGGYGYWDWVANGIIHATDSGAKIISMSLGGSGDSELVHEAIRYAYNAGVLIVAAAGNSDSDMKSYPAAYDEVISVAATDRYDNKAWFSNWGEWIELAAPGVDIFSTVPWGYESWSGTSMACPHVSGLAALVFSEYPERSRDWVRAWLKYTADDLGDRGFDVYYGYGRINARKAIAMPPPQHELIASEWATPQYVESGDTAIVNATVLNFGDGDEAGVTVQLLANNSVVDSAVIDSLPHGESSTVSLVWTPLVQGSYNVTAYVAPVFGEENLENNALWKYIFCGSPVKAVVLHSAGNVLTETITNWQALNNQWYIFGSTMIYVDYTTLNKQDITYEDLVGSKADVLIISCAFDPYSGWEFTDAEIDATTQYVKEGHGLILTAGTLYYMVPNNNKLGQLVGINATINLGTTSTDLLHLLNSTHPLFARVPNPLVFPRVATVFPSDGIWDSNELAGGEYAALGHFSEGAIITYRGLVFISPWLEVIPPYYHHHLQTLYNAIVWSRYEKPPHELVASLDVPRGLKPCRPAILNATVKNMGVRDETNVTLRLYIGDSVVSSATIPDLYVDDSYTLEYAWTPSAEGTYNITAYAVPVLGEEDVADNVKSLPVIVSNLLVALFENDDPWGFQSNQQALDRYGIPYAILGSEEFGRVDLGQFTKVVIASDQDQAFYDGVRAHVSWFEKYAKEGGVLEIHAADYGWHGGAWTGPLPGELGWASYYGQFVTVIDHSHPLLNSPNAITDAELDNWNYAVHGYFEDVPANAHVVIVEDTFGMPAYLEFSYGAGTIVATAQTLEWGYQQHWSLLLENSLLYMPKRFEHDVQVGLEAIESIELGGSAVLKASVLNRGVSSEASVELHLLINDTTVDHTVVSLLPGESYTMSYVWSPASTGAFNITAYALPLSGEENVADNLVTEWVSVFHYARLTFPPEWAEGGQPMNWRADDGCWELTLPFDFPFYGVNYGRIFVSSNGLISFEGLDSSYVNSILGLADKLAIAVAWDDLRTDGRQGDDIFVWQPDADHVIIRWQVVSFNGLAEANFEAVLSSNGEVQLNYGYSSGFITATIGISNGLGHIVAEDVTDLNCINSVMLTPFMLEHELAVTLEAPAFPQPGDPVLLNATVQNIGENNESDVLLEILINDAVLDSVVISELPSCTSYVLSCLWSPGGGVYNVTAFAPCLFGERYAQDNTFSKRVEGGVRDVAVADVTVSSDRVYQGGVVGVNVTVANLGGADAGFLVTLYYDEVVIAVRSVENLAPNETSILSFVWNTTFVPYCHNYTIRAEASTILGETNTANNVYVGGHVKVKIPGDVNNDGFVDVRDATRAILCFNSYCGHAKWDPDADINCDGRVDTRDIVIVVINFRRC
jgi:thermitase